jgi:transcriptional regulator with XRE-family HTH domain
MPPHDLGAVIRETRKRRGWSDQQLADAIHIDKSHVARIERSDASITLSVAEDIAKALHAPRILRTACELAQARLTVQRDDAA